MSQVQVLDIEDGFDQVESSLSCSETGIVMYSRETVNVVDLSV